MAFPRGMDAAVRLPDGRVLVVGGSSSSEGSGTAELFDPGTGTWSQAGNLPSSISDPLAALLPDGRVLAVGTDAALNPAAEIFDPTTGSWSAVAAPPSAHGEGTASLVGGKVLIAGGNQSAASSTVDSYDPTSGSWTPVGQLNVPRYGHSATVLADGRLLVAGGCNPIVGGYLSSLEIFDPATGAWTRVGNLLSIRMLHTASLLPSGDVVFAGGLPGATTMSPTASVELIPSASLLPVPPTVPGAPQTNGATPANSQVTLNWIAPADDGGSPITGYRITTFVNGALQSTVIAAAGSVNGSYVVTGLSNGTAYTFNIATVNSVGTGPDATFPGSWTPASVPDAPTSVTAGPGDAQATVSWTAPNANGSAITGYTVSWSGGNQACPASPCLVSGLTNGTAYTFTVTATNAIGTGPASAASGAVTPAAVPGAPTGVSAIGGNGQATVSWTPPSDNGSAITGYTVIWSGGSQPCPGEPCTVAALSNGTPYTFTVTATNAVGTGPASVASIAVTPATVPDAPTAVTATGGNAQATVSWAAPTASGGSPLTGYRVTPYIGVTAQTWISVGLVTNLTVTGLTNGTAYTFTVTALNGVGPGAESLPSTAVTPEPPPPPTISAVAPNTGLTMGGTVVTITGTGFTAVTAVKFGTAAAFAYTVNSATQITATSPPGTGTVDVRITALGGPSATIAADRFTYIPPGAQCTAVSLTPNVASPQLASTSVKFTAHTTGCSNPQFQYWLLAPGGHWTSQGNYGIGPWTWNPVQVAGTYQVGVWARQFGWTHPYDVYGITTFVLKPAGCISAALVPSSAPPQALGVQVTFAPSATGCLSPQYRFWLRPPGRTWTMVQDYGVAPTWQFDTSRYTSGNFQVGVWARQVGSPRAYETFSISSYWISPRGICVVSGLRPSAASPQVRGALVTFTPQQTGCSQQYRFWLLPPGGSWQSVQAYGVSGTWLWKSAGYLPGTYEIGVWEGSTRTPSNYESYAITTFTLTAAPTGACTSSNLRADPLSPQKPGTPVTFMASAGGCAIAPQFEFWLLAPGGTWTSMQPYGGPTWGWTPPALTGTYQVGVWARQGGSKSAYESYFIGTYQVVP